MLKTSTIAKQIRARISGEVSRRSKTLKLASHDASLFEVMPRMVVYPRHVSDIEKVVDYVNQHRAVDAGLSLTVRSGGTDMSGGAINDSIILDMTRYFDRIGGIHGHSVTFQPGAYYRDFEPKTLAAGLLMPSYPASKDLCTLGGMLANNSGGEKSLVYGKTDKYVEQLKIVLRDGQEHTITPLTKSELKSQLKAKGLLADIYRQVNNLVVRHKSVIEKSRPKVSKNSTGYNIWDVWDGKTFDLTKLIIGSQGTLGIITEAKFRLIEAKPLSGMVVLFLPSLKKLGEIINATLALGPTSLESFDQHTLKFAIRFFLSFRKTLGFKRFALLGLSFIPLLNKLLKYLPNLPEIIILVEFEGDDQTEIDKKIQQTIKAVQPFDVETHVAADKRHEEKFWIMRRESFNLLRKNVKRKHTAPYIDDLIVPPKHLPKFLPELTEILERYELLYTVAGHMGDGNFHIIPLMDFNNQAETDKIPASLKEVTKLVLKYDGSLSGEHNDGLIRGPFLKDMFSEQALSVQRQVKTIFDPDNIFNPHKKTTANWEYSAAHIRKSF